MQTRRVANEVTDDLSRRFRQLSQTPVDHIQNRPGQPGAAPLAAGRLAEHADSDEAIDGCPRRRRGDAELFGGTGDRGDKCVVPGHGSNDFAGLRRSKLVWIHAIRALESLYRRSGALKEKGLKF